MRIKPTSSTAPQPVTGDSVSAGVHPAAGVTVERGTGAETAPAAAAAVQKPDLEAVVEKMNQALHIFSQSLQFEVAEGNRIVVRVIDTASGEVIRQIPPEELLETYRRLQDALGVLIDRRV